MEADPGRRRGGWLERLPPALRRRDFSLLWAALLVEGLGAQMAPVAVGWQVFEIRHSPLDLGLIGLAEFAPLPLLALPAGHLADRFPRRLLFAGATGVMIVVSLLLLVVSLNGAQKLWPFLVLAVVAGCANAIAIPPGRALPATVVPFELIANAMALRSIAFQGAMIVGPAIGGLLFTISGRARLRHGGGAALDRARLHARAPRAGARADAGGAEPRDRARRHPLHPPHADPARRDHARPLRRAARRRDRARAGVRADDPRHRARSGLGLLRSAPAVGALAAGADARAPPAADERRAARCSSWSRSSASA